MNGIVLIDKPEGWTSHDVVAKLRGILGERRIGHSGTLDPMATGLLVVFVGRATRAVEFAESHDKEYEASVRFGVSTNTQDITGEIMRETGIIPSDDELFAVLPRFTGGISQLPPMFSAVKIGGRKLYELARSGAEVERKPRQITISTLEYLGECGGERSFRVACSKGTYIRTLFSDMGDALGCGAALSALRRTRAGEYGVEAARTLEDITRLRDEGRLDETLLPVDTLFKAHPSVTISSAQRKKCLCGAGFPIEAENGAYRVYDEAGDFLMLGEVKNGNMMTVKSFFEV